MDRASLVITISFVGGTVLLAALVWLLVRLDRRAAPVPAVSAPLGDPVPVVAGVVVVRDPAPEPEPEPVPEARPIVAPDDASRTRIGVAAGTTAFVAILLVVLGARRRHRRRTRTS